MKKFLIALCLLACSFSVSAGNIKEIIFFGDSLSDSGNLYAAMLHIIPKSPPYFEGRFSNGPVWAEHVAGYYRNKYGIGSHNYAVGGATAVFKNPFKGYLPFAVDEEITNYLVATAFQDRSETLCIIWIGANDYLNGAENIDSATTATVKQTIYITTRLIKHGVKHFMFLNLPDLSKTPLAKLVDYSSSLHTISVLHNLKMATALDQVAKEHKDVKIISYDVMTLFSDMVSNIGKYNQKYKTHIKNTGDACWNGGYTLKANKYSQEQMLGMELTQTFKNHPSLATNNVNVQALAHHILSSPDLAEAYNVGNLAADGAHSCSNPDDYLFWDHVHPSEAAHQIMTGIVIETLHREGMVG